MKKYFFIFYKYIQLFLKYRKKNAEKNAEKSAKKKRIGGKG